MGDASLRLSAIGRREFDDFRRLIRDVSGIALGDGKDALLASRVARRMRALGVSDHGEYLEMVRSDRTGTEMCHLIDAISTNVTSFFREEQHFSVLEQRLLELGESRVSEVRLWSAACATGEEPYSMAMVAAGALASTSVRVRILATDISGAALDVARQGLYDSKRVAPVPASYRSRYLKRSGDRWSVTPELKNLVSFARINLSTPPMPMAGPFDAIMCRNVMIYFGPDTRSALVAELERLLAPGGLLMLGHAESLAGIATGLRPLGPAVYAKAQRS